MNEQQINAISTLEEDFQKYKDVQEQGCNDPNWEDGTNLNLIRNHIIFDKSFIEQAFEGVQELPSVYYQETPKLVNPKYMANPDKIREQADKAIKMFKNYFYLDEINNAQYYLDEKQLRDVGICKIVNRISGLEKAIQEDDLLNMRNMSVNPEEQLETMDKVFKNLKTILNEEDRQISMFEIKM